MVIADTQRSNTRAVEPRAINPSCFNAIDRATANAFDLQERLRAVVDRLIGPPMVQMNSLNPNMTVTGEPRRPGMLFQAEDQANTIDRYIEEMNADLTRLEQALP